MNNNNNQYQIITGDTIEKLKEIEDNFIDLTITSPPYDNLRSYNNAPAFNENIWSNTFVELYRVTKDGGVVVWVVGDASINGTETGTSFKQALKAMEIGFNLHDTMIYEKNSISFPSKNRYYQIFEYMFIFSKGRPKTNNLIKDRKNKWAGFGYWGDISSRKGKNEILVKKKNDRIIPEFSIRTNIWKYNTGKGFSTKDKEAFKHPAIFPEKLAEDHVLSWSNEGDLVLDPFCGSGTTIKMAVLNNRNAIGIDINEEYCAIAKNRIDKCLKST